MIFRGFRALQLATTKDARPPRGMQELEREQKLEQELYCVTIYDASAYHLEDS